MNRRISMGTEQKSADLPYLFKLFLTEIPSSISTKADPERSGLPSGSMRPESAASHELTVRALTFYLGRTPSPEELAGRARTPQGKPYFPGYPDFMYSISHSGRYAVCGMIFGGRDPQPVGIDIQEISEDPKRVMKIADHFFSDRERESLHTLLDGGAETGISAALLLFNRFWTARECYMKLTGRGLAESFRNFRPDLEAGRIVLTSPDQAGADASADASSGEIFLTECPAPEGFCLTACSYVPITKAAVSVVRV